MLANVDARGEPVPTARFMGGREVELVAGADGAAAPPATPADVAAIVATGVMALPSFVAGSGPVHRPSRRDPRRSGAAARRGARRWRALYAALTVDVMLDKLGRAGPVLVEGSFHRNAAFCGLLAALRARPAGPRHRRSERHRPRRLAARPLGRAADAGPTRCPRPCSPWQVAGLAPYRARWRALSAGDRPA